MTLEKLEKKDTKDIANARKMATPLAKVIPLMEELMVNTDLLDSRMAALEVAIERKTNNIEGPSEVVTSFVPFKNNSEIGKVCLFHPRSRIFEAVFPTSWGPAAR